MQATDVDIQRAMYEHAIAVLIGKPPASFTLPPDPITVAAPTIPAIPGMLPSQLLERRPDIASAERSMAAANEQIGIAQDGLLSHAVALGSGWIRGHIRNQLVFVAEPLLRRRPHALRRRSSITAAGAPPPTLPWRSTMAPSRHTARPRSPHSSRLKTI